jgi:hypothetical protein
MLAARVETENAGDEGSQLLRDPNLAAAAAIGAP